jgi:DNA modification methylase
VGVELHLGDCRDVLPTLPDNSVDSIVTDPPYELGFMNKRWDSTGIAYDVNVWRECLRVLKPGGHLLAFGGSRTYHRLACAVEDAGFEIRDQIMWVYGSGFPKSLDVSKAIDKAAGAERKVVGRNPHYSPGRKEFGVMQSVGDTRNNDRPCFNEPDAPERAASVTAPATPDALRWQGWGTALKPAHEPLVLARKPLIGTVAANVLKWGCGALNIDGCRVDHDEPMKTTVRSAPRYSGRTMANGIVGGIQSTVASAAPLGRWPANVIHDGSDEVVAEFAKAGNAGALAPVRGTEPSQPAKNVYGEYGRHVGTFYGDSGSAARFFYCAKASKRDRDEGLEDGLEWLDSIELVDYDGSIYSLSEVLLWESRDQSPSTALNGEALLVRGTSGDTTPERSGNGSCTISYGKPLMAQSLTGIRFTTSTGTRKTIASKTLNSLPVSNTSDCTEAAIETLMACGLSPVESVACISLWRLITTSAGMAYRPGAKSVAKPTPLQISGSGALRQRLARNIHSTVKPTALMRYLCRLVTPPGGVILDLFMGSGSTGKAAVLEGFGFVGIEKEAEYLAIAERRIEHARMQPSLLAEAAE